MKKLFKNIEIRNAIFLGSLCSVSYLVVYIARNMLSAVSPQMIETGGFSTEYIGEISSVYFILYAFGQLINGVVGDKIKAIYMISFGLILGGACTFIFPYLADGPTTAKIIYGMSGFFLSMFYAPMSKLVAENTKYIYAVRCSIAYNFAALLGTPLAGVLAAVFVWQSVFKSGSSMLVVMGIICYIIFYCMEKKGIVKYNQFDQTKDKTKGNENGIKILIKNRIIRFTIISILTGVVRTTVVFWMPTYFVQYLGFSTESAASIFAITTLIISTTTFITVYVYEKLHRNMDLTILLSFLVATISFFLVFVVKAPILNVLLLVVAIMAANAASTVLWSMYCPSLKDTGMVSSATGYLDFVSYMAASVSSTLFANAVSTIGWGNLILVWGGLMLFGVLMSLPVREILNKLKREN